MYKYILKLKHFKDAIQYTYTTSNFIHHDNTSISNSSKTSLINKDESLRCSISRSISNIKELCLSNSFDYFFTLTIKSKKRNNVFWATHYLSNKMKNYAKKFDDFSFIYVFEKQKKGGIHLHGFVKGLGDLYINDYGHLESKYFKKVGFHSFVKLDKVNPFYIIKYISKNPLPEVKHRYFRSKNLLKADVSYIHCIDDDFKDFQWKFKSPFCKMVTIKK